jgi:hypothetical protein
VITTEGASDQQRWPDNQSQEGQRRRQIIEFEHRRDEKAARSPGVRTQAIVVVVAATQIPDAQDGHDPKPRFVVKMRRDNHGSRVPS